MEEFALSYLHSFFTDNERSQLNALNSINISVSKDDCLETDIEYINLVKLYKSLLNCGVLDKYRIETGPNCTYLIEELFKRYVNNDTFVLTTEQEHPAVKYFLNTDNIYILQVEDINRSDVIKRIIRKYKQSKCKNFFLMMAGVIPGSAKILDQNFFIGLKQALVINKIPNVLILDDCQGIYMVDRDYSIFDGILGTAHVLIKSNFEMGILLTKLPHKIGYINKAGLNAFKDGLQIVCNHKSDAKKFNTIFKQLLKAEIDGKAFEIKEGQAPHMLVLSANRVPFNQKYADRMEASEITFSELNSPVGMIRLRYQEAVNKDPEVYINTYIKELKRILKALKRAKELKENTDFNNSINIDYDFTINKDNIKIGEINKKPLEKTFYTKENDMENAYTDTIEVNAQRFHYIYNKVR